MADERKGGNGPGHGGDRRGYSWPPFEPGNTITLRHGARSDRFVEPLARAFAEVLLADRPDLAAYPETVAAWATAEARCERLRVWHAEHGLIDGSAGKVRAAKDTLAFEAQAERLRARLGLDPMSDAQLQKSRSEAVLSVVDLESIRQRGREALARREQQVALVAAAEEREAEVVDGEASDDV